MGQLRIALRAYADEGHPPAAIMARTSAFLATALLMPQMSKTRLYNAIRRNHCDAGSGVSGRDGCAVACGNGE